MLDMALQPEAVIGSSADCWLRQQIESRSQAVRRPLRA